MGGPAMPFAAAVIQPVTSSLKKLFILRPNLRVDDTSSAAFFSSSSFFNLCEF